MILKKSDYADGKYDAIRRLLDYFEEKQVTLLTKIIFKDLDGISEILFKLLEIC